MCSAKILHVCCASGNAAKFHAPCLLQKMLSGRWRVPSGVLIFPTCLRTFFSVKIGICVLTESAFA